MKILLIICAVCIAFLFVILPSDQFNIAMSRTLYKSLIGGFAGLVSALFVLLGKALKKREAKRIQQKKDAGMTDEQIAESENTRNSKQLYIGAAVIIALFVAVVLLATYS